MGRFEPGSSGIGSDSADNCATTIAMTTITVIIFFIFVFDYFFYSLKISKYALHAPLRKLIINFIISVDRSLWLKSVGSS